MRTRFPIAAMAALMLSSGAVGAPAAANQSDLLTAPQGVQETNLSQQELQTFAVAALEVNRIGADYQPRFESAGTAEERQQIEEEASKKMVEAVEDKGLSVDQYNYIALLAESDPSVAEQIEQHIRQTH